MSWLISPAQLDKFRKNQKNVIILDASWHLPADNRDASGEFVSKHIPGAKFFDFDLFHDQQSALPSMALLDEKLVASRLGALGITNEHKIIFYDNSDLRTSCRALWLLKVFGHHPFQLYVLDGGLRYWEQNGGKLETGEARLSVPKSYTVKLNSGLIRSLSQMKANLHDPHEMVIDVRHPVRYSGGRLSQSMMRTGHIPGSFCFPYFTMLQANGCFKPLEKIRAQLQDIGVDFAYPMVATCGSGMTAAMLDFVLGLLDHPRHAIYDGSWSEWGADTLYADEISLDERPVRTSLD